MTIKIDKNGYLFLDRNGSLKSQMCPFASQAGQNCGDWCPLFHAYENKVELYCGSGLIIFTPFGSGETFTDERN